MCFKDVLNKYLSSIGITSKDLSTYSGISMPVISRYRSGERTPRIKSDQLDKLASSIDSIAREKGINGYNKDDILREFTSAINDGNSFNYENFNMVITSLNINISDMARNIVFDASHISRIRYGKAKPSDYVSFCNKVCNYIVSKYSDDDAKMIICSILKCDMNTICDNDKYFNALFSFFTNNSRPYKNDIRGFLENLDSFDLNDYIKSIKFDELKVPSIPFYKGKSKNYYGIEEMKNGEIGFFKATVLSKSHDDIFMCSDMPMEDMAQDTSFGKKWMFGIAMCLKKGLHLNIIHNLDRSFNEMMLGLESWIPIYMTGLVSPYYLKEVKNSVYQHLNYSSGIVYLTGECIRGHHNKGKYYLTNNNKEVLYGKEKMKLLFEKANTLMDIYRSEDYDSYRVFLANSYKTRGDRKRIYSSLPLSTMSDDLLLRILKRNKVSKNDIKRIFDYKREEEENTNIILKENRINDVIFNLSSLEFDSDNICLSLENMFFEDKIYYSYSEYLEHFNRTMDISNKCNNYSVTVLDYQTFKNINITILDDKYVILSKSNSPIIHFVIRHPKLVYAISNFNPLVKE